MGSMMFSPEEMGAMSGGILPPAPKNYKLPTQFPSFDHAPRIAIDLESVDPSLAADTGPGWRRGAYIVGFGVALQDHAGKTAFKEYYPLRHKAGPNLDPDRVFNGWLGTELAFYQGEITGANLLYDTDGFQYEDVTAPMAKWRDVQWAEALLDESAPSYKLETLGKKYLGIGKTTNLLKALYGPGYIERFHEIHPGHARNYVLGDCDLPLAVLEKQMEAMRKQDLLELWDVECGLLPFMLYMRKLGVRVDLNEAARLGTMFDAKRDAALTAASKLCGIRLDPDNFQKPAVREMIFQRLKIPVHHSANGKISVTDDWLESLDHPIGELLAAANKYEKAKGTFVDGYITDCAIGDRVHCEFHPLRRIKEKEGGFGGGVNGTATGRFSGTNPNLQNIPARDPVIGPLCRGMFIADEGCDWWSQDYCIAPNTRVLTAKLEWKESSALHIGEELIGCDELPKVNKKQGHRWLRRTAVESIKRLRQPCVRITTDQGVVTCSTEHRWLSRKGQQTYTWRRAKKLKAGHIIAFVCKPWNIDTSNDGGYLSGLFDGEGTVGYGSLSFAQKPSGDNLLVLEKGIRLLKERNYAIHVDTDVTNSVRINGGREEQMRFLGSVRPERLLAKSACVWENKMLRSKTTPAARILSVEYLGEQDVLAIQTTEKTFIAEGFVSHNSQIEYRMLVHYAVELKCKGAEIAQAMYIANPKTDFHEACAQLVWAQDWQAVAADFAAGKIDEAMRDKRWKKIRGPAKNLNFGLVYGMGKVLLAHSIDGGWDDVNQCPTPHALQIMDAYHAGAPFVRDLNNKCMAYADKHGFIDTILNRRRRFELWEPKKYDKGQRRTAVDYDKAVAEWGKAYIKRAMTHKALNSRLQGSAADLMKLAMVKLWEGGIFDPGNDITCVLTVHDELNGSYVPSTRGLAALREVKHIMESCMKLHIPVLTSGSTGSNWSEAK